MWSEIDIYVRMPREVNKVKIGLVMEGGANRSMFTAGVLDVLMENGIELDASIGVSAGAAFGCNYASKQIGRAIRYNKRFAKDWRYASWRSFFLTGDLYGAKFDYEKLPYELDIFDYQEFMKHDFYCVCTNALTGEPLYYHCDEDDKKTMQYIRASASMPVVSHAVEVDGMKLLDGGIADSIPLQYFESIGYKKNVVILTQPSSYRKEPMKHTHMMKLLLKKYPAIYQKLKKRHLAYNKQLSYIKKRGEYGDAFIIQPPFSLNIPALCHSAQEKERVYRIGRQQALKQLASLKHFINEARNEEDH